MSSYSNKDVIQVLGLSIPPILYVMGNIGCICNYITLTDRKLRKSSCTINFFASSIIDFLILNFNLLSRWIHDAFQIDSNQTRFLFYLFASIDRWPQSSLNVNRRKFSNRTIAYYFIPVIIIFWLVVLSHQLIFYDMSNGICNGNSKSYDIFHGIFNLFCIGIIPSFSLATFGYLTLQNVKRSIRRINPMNNLIIMQTNIHRKQNQLITMVLVQVITTICLTFPYLLVMFYIIISRYFYDTKTLNQHRDIDNLLDLITRDLWYLNYTKSFYIYTLSSTLFRNIFKKRLQKCFPYRICVTRNVILPQGRSIIHTIA